MDLSSKDPNWGKNITYDQKNPPLKGKKPAEKDFRRSLGQIKPKARHNIEKVEHKTRLPPAKYGEVMGHGNYSPSKISVIDESHSKE